MKSIQSALDRTVEIGDCMVWNLTTNSQGLPITWHNGKPGQSVPRIVFAMHSNVEVEDLGPLMVWAGCKTKACIKPEHLCCGTKSQFWAWKRKQGSVKLTAGHLAAVTAAVRRRPGVTGSMEKAREVRAMRADGKTLAECSAAHGISADMVSRIDRGLNWREGIASSSAFTFRP